MRTKRELQALKNMPVLKRGMWVYYSDPKSSFVLQGIVTSLKDVVVGPDTVVRMRMTDQYGNQVTKIGKSEDVAIAAMTLKPTLWG